jgi:hypothetical protein
MIKLKRITINPYKRTTTRRTTIRKTTINPYKKTATNYQNFLESPFAITIT